MLRVGSEVNVSAYDPRSVGILVFTGEVVGAGGLPDRQELTFLVRGRGGYTSHLKWDDGDHHIDIIISPSSGVRIVFPDGTVSSDVLRIEYS